jgi:membrane dipeptidase
MRVPMRNKAAAVLTFLLLPCLCVAASTSPEYPIRVARILAETPLIDGHNDLPWRIRESYDGKLSKIDLSHDIRLTSLADNSSTMTDIPRLRNGHVGGQFWSVYVPVDLHGALAVQTTVEQIDLVRRMALQYPADLEIAYTAADIRRIHRSGRIASLIGIEGGHQINNSLPVLRELYTLGARYMTLTHILNTDWADSATDSPKHHGLTSFGREVIREMNRLGMLVDLSHVSPETMRAAIQVSEAPVIFSHSSARALVDHPRNVPDDVLVMLAQNGGVVMVNFYPGYISEACNQWDAEHAAAQARFSSPPYAGLYVGQPDRAQIALDEWTKSHPAPQATVSDVADHIEHIRRVAGIDHVGLGSDFDGIPVTPQGLEGPDKYPSLLVELLRRGWTDQDIAKIAGENILRALAAAQGVAARPRTARMPSEETIEVLDASVKAAQ